MRQLVSRAPTYPTALALAVLVSSCTSSPSSTDLVPIAPPFATLQVAPAELTINADRDTLVAMDNGTSIYIPKDAFQTTSGKPVTGEVTLQYRQFDTPGAVIASGIPMTYTDGAGEKQQMESAGMFDIRGFSGEEPIAIREGKSLDVNLSSAVNGDFDLFYFEEDGSGQQGAWKTVVKNTLDESPDIANGRSLQFDTVGFPETRLLSDLTFDISGAGQQAPPDWVYQELWNVMDISRPFYFSQVINQYTAQIHFAEESMYWAPPPSVDTVPFWTLENETIILRDWRGNALHTLDGAGAGLTVVTAAGTVPLVAVVQTLTHAVARQRRPQP
ncbi:MAG: hypothetical protein AAGB22_15340, partial [Bacteroidota bacterium]